MGMFTILRDKRRRRSSFAEAMEEDSSWVLQTRMAAKSKNKKLTPEELVEQARERYESSLEEEVDFIPEASQDPAEDPRG